MEIVFHLCANIHAGAVVFVLPDGKTYPFGPGPRATAPRVVVNTYRFFTKVFTSGDIGLGEAYMAGEWRCDDLPGFIRLLIVNREVFADGNPFSAVVARIVNRGRHLLNKNTIPGSRRNVHRHYDLDSHLFELFLDESMTYSCGLFDCPDVSLDQAQVNKLHTIIGKAGVGKDDHLLEIGCGWGGFALEAVRMTGCRVTGITVSEKQFDFARRRVAAGGHANRIDIRLCDYRQLQGQFDRIISIEMLEAVGHAYLGTFFKCCDRLLKPGGKVVIQTITIPDQHYARYRREADWIQKYIFPGACIPSLTALCTAMTGHSQLVVEHIENIGLHYAKTLRAWRRRFRQNRKQVFAMGFDRRFVRKWDYYLSLCEAGFAEKALGDLQMVLARSSLE
ncbi:MAG: class I SAM-dependent methyltransferase [Desulfobacterales bacterium]|nr:class I SAM-dependent methyltransferase [Desulfobacterales bacterium]